MKIRRDIGWQLALLWLVLLSAYAVAFRQGTLVPWGTGAGSGALGAPLWSLAPLTATLVLTVVITFRWLRARGRIGEAREEGKVGW